MKHECKEDIYGHCYFCGRMMVEDYVAIESIFDGLERELEKKTTFGNE